MEIKNKMQMVVFRSSKHEVHTQEPRIKHTDVERGGRGPQRWSTGTGRKPHCRHLSTIHLHPIFVSVSSLNSMEQAAEETPREQGSSEEQECQWSRALEGHRPL